MTGEDPALGEQFGRLRAWLGRLARHKMVWLIVGGAAGTVLRYWISQWVGSHAWGRVFPWGTFIINVSGSFVLGFAALLIRERLRPEHGDLYLLIGTGFCGGYTTFSTFELETWNWVQKGSWPLALVNVAGSAAAGFVGVALGWKLAEGIFGPR